jgi:N,N'-diacetyllegionaminate synthase
VTNIRTEIIAEVANAHQGDPRLALTLARHAAEAGADAVKFQVYFADELLATSHSRYEHFRALEFEGGFWEQAIAEVHRLGVRAYCDVFGTRAFDVARAAGADGYKIHASDLCNVPLLRYIASHSGRIFLSVGGATIREIGRALGEIDLAPPRDIVLLHGVQTYPTPPEDAGLARLQFLSRTFGVRCAVGYMDHTAAESTLAWALPILAMGMGATVLEKHITEDRSVKGLDYYSSFEPAEFARFVGIVRECDAARATAPETFSASERKYRVEVRKKWVAASRLAEGDVLTVTDLQMKRAAGDGHCPDLAELVGKVLIRSIEVGEPIGANDVRQRVAALVVARMTSARLAAKALVDVGGMPALAHLFARLSRATCLDEMILCTTREPADDVLVAAAEQWGVTVYRGESEDVLARMLGALNEHPADLALRITGDDILVDPQYLDAAVRYHLRAGAEYTSAKDLPSGTEVEVFNVGTLRDLHRLSRDGSGTEYLTAYITDHRDQFRCAAVPVSPSHAKPYRLTLDTEADLTVIRRLLAHMTAIGRPIDYTLDDIVTFMDSNPELRQLNAVSEPSQLPASVTTAFEWSRLA